MANILIIQTLRYLKSLPVPYIVILCVWELEVMFVDRRKTDKSKEKCNFYEGINRK